MVTISAPGRALRRLARGALLLGCLIGGALLFTPEVGAAPTPDAATTSGGNHAESPPPRRGNESGMIGDVRTVISAEAAIQGDARRIYDRP